MYKDFLSKLYDKYQVYDCFNHDYRYLSNAIDGINSLWYGNINEVKKVRIVILAEAPLWGKKEGEEKYFYNPNSEHSQFFYGTDLTDLYSGSITSKSDLIAAVNNLGIIILDISPFPFNPATTAISYRRDDEKRSKQLLMDDYREIVRTTFSTHVKPKLDVISKIVHNCEQAKYVYRYSRVQKLNSTISISFKESGYTIFGTIDLISQLGGGINRDMLKKSIVKDTR